LRQRPVSVVCARADQRYAAQDLAQGVPYFIDVVSVRDGIPTLRPTIEAMPYRYAADFIQHGGFRFTVIVVGDAVRSAQQRIEVQWNGDLTKLTAGPTW
jgi:hypothetical protein